MSRIHGRQPFAILQGWQELTSRSSKKNLPQDLMNFDAAKSHYHITLLIYIRKFIGKGLTHAYTNKFCACANFEPDFMVVINFTLLCLCQCEGRSVAKMNCIQIALAVFGASR